jgi:hypothetical protein
VHKKAKIASMKDMMLCAQEDTNCLKEEHGVIMYVRRQGLLQGRTQGGTYKNTNFGTI